MRKFRKRKVTKDVLKEMKKLREKGLSYDRISKVLNLHSSTINYHLNEKTKEKIKERNRERNKQNPVKYNKYHREYQKHKYRYDLDFREKQKKRSREYQKKKRKNE